MRCAALLCLLVAAVPAAARDRTYSIVSFDRIRVVGPYEVRLTTGKSPSGVASGDENAVDDVQVRVEGTTLTIGRIIRNTQASAPRAPVVITLATPALRGAIVTGGGRLTIDGWKAQRADISLNGAGAATVNGIDADQITATVIGPGAIALGGVARRAQLLTNGTGTIDAATLIANDLTVRLDGPGRTLGNARYTATVTNSGLGTIQIDGDAKCTIAAPAGGPVTCGKGK